MPKTKDAFALRDIYEAINESNDKVIGKWIGSNWVGVFNTPLQLSGNGRFETGVQILEGDKSGFQKKIERVEAHIIQLQEYLERIVDRLISGDDNNETRARAARAKALRSIYEFILKGLLHDKQVIEKLIVNYRDLIPAEFKRNFGERLRQARIQKGLTINQVAEMVYLSYNGYSQYERGMREPPLWILSNLAKILDVSADWLLGIEK